jgi:N-acyl-L-homoserine lactone synthetase
MSSLLADSCNAILRDFIIEAATTPERGLEAQRLRHQVYCVERGFQEIADGGVEADAFDVHSVHALVIHRASGNAIGAVRLVLPDGGNRDFSFPLQKVCSIPLGNHTTLERTAEVSRLAISKQRLMGIKAPPALLRLALLRAVVMLSAQRSLTHWCAVMEPTLLRLLAGSGIHFVQLGGLVEYHGLRQPCCAKIAQMLARVRREQPDVWTFVTADGKFDMFAETQASEAA